MFSIINPHVNTSTVPVAQTTLDCSGRYSRNEKEDMQKAIEYLYEFRKKIDELHPNCLILVDNMLQRNRGY